MSCIYRPRCNQIWSVWYCLFCCGIHAYLVYLGVERYRLYADMIWGYDHEKPQIYLYIYIGLHALVIACSPFFIAFALFKTGNLAGDNERLGQRTEKIMEMEERTCCPRKFKSVWQHGPPAAQTVHLIMAFAILMAQQLMVAKLYEKGELKHEDTFNTELDFIFRGAERLGKILPNNLSYYHRGPFQDYSLQKVSENNPKFLPLLVNQKLFGINLEFLNYFVALCTFASVYPSVFWRASRCFTGVFSAQLMLWVFTAIFSYIDFEVLYRIHLMSDPRRFPRLPDNIRSLKEAFLLPNHYCVLGSYLITTLGMFFAAPILYGYGYTRFCISWQQMVQQRSWDEAQRNSEERSSSGIMKTSMNGNAKVGCCEGYCPHLVAIVLLLILVGAKILILYDTMLIFLNDWPHYLSLTIVAVDVCYLFSWILLWLVLTCKRNWEFKVTYSVPEILNLLQTNWASGPTWARYKKGVVEPDNAMILMSGADLYITESPQQKSAILRQAHKYGLGSPKEEVYWLHPGNLTGSSPVEGRRQVNPVILDKNSPENAHLLGSQQQYQPDPRSLPPYQPPTKEVTRTMDSRVSGSYMRFGDVENGPQATFEDQQRTRDLATTFGTLPRGEYKKRRMLQGSDADFQYGPYNQGGPIRGRQGSDSGGGAYASIHKARPSPTPSGMHASREYMRQGPEDGSRQSSYANLPGSRTAARSQQQLREQQLREARAPPQARVISVGGTRENSIGAPSSSTMNSQHSTPQSGRAFIGSQQQQISNQNLYATVNGDGSQYAPMTRIRQSPTSQREKAYAESQPPMGYRGGPAKLSSFSDVNKPEGIYGSVGAGIQKQASRETTPQSNASSTLTRANAHNFGAPPPTHQATVTPAWNHNPVYGYDPNSAAYDPNITPTSTLTSQGSYTVTGPGSPPESGGTTSASSSAHTYAALNGNSEQPQLLLHHQHSHPPSSTAIKGRKSSNSHLTAVATGYNHHGDRNDSANYSLTSSNESDPNQAQFATSIV